MPMRKPAPRLRSLMRTRKVREFSLALFLFAFLVLLPPLITVFESPATVFGVPLVYAFLFSAWAAIIATVFVISEWAGTKEPFPNDAKSRAQNRTR